jgi:peptidoglycan-N-acetylglucosamine deacetylase
MTGRVTLTFDNGPTKGVTDFVLDQLAARDVHATFFVVGTKIEGADGHALIERAHAEGHWVGNHTLTHSTPLALFVDPADVDHEIDRTQALIGGLAHPDRLFRPYSSGGVIDRRLLGAHGRQRLLDDGFTCCLWNCLPRDWLEPEQWVETCLAMIESTEWAVVVVHDLPTGAMTHLPRFLDAVASAGIEIVQEFPDSCVPIRRGEPTESYNLLEV